MGSPLFDADLANQIKELYRDTADLIAQQDEAKDSEPTDFD